MEKKLAHLLTHLPPAFAHPPHTPNTRRTLSFLSLLNSFPPWSLCTSSSSPRGCPPLPLLHPSPTSRLFPWLAHSPPSVPA